MDETRLLIEHTTPEGNTDVATTERPHQQPARLQPEPVPAAATTTPRDGYTLVELLLVVVILGVLTSVVALGVSGMSSEAADTGCRADRHQLHVAAEAFFAQTRVDLIPATGTGHDRFERTLVDRGFLHGTSTYHDLAADGALTPENPSC